MATLGRCALAAVLVVGCALDPLAESPGIAGASDPVRGDDPPGDEASESGSDGGDPARDDASIAETGSSGGETDSTSGDADGTTTASTETETARVRVATGATENAELVETLPVGRSEGNAKRRVVMRLSPGDLPDLLEGDRLIVPAEVQVTTRCDVGQSAAGCDYNPKIRAQLVLTGEADDTDPAGPESRALSSELTQTCTKNEHHCMFVFRPKDATTVLGDLPCVADDDCRVNLVMWAWDGQARAGGKDEVIVGGNEGNYLDNGIVESDKARLMAIRERGIGAGDRHERETTGGGTKNVPTNADPVLVYAHALKGGDGDLRKGEQFVVEAKIVASVGGRARFSTEMFVTKKANATDGGGLEKIAPQKIGEHNGINCLPSENRCVTRKVAVFRVTDDIAGPVYVNVVVKSAVPGGGSTNVRLHLADGWVRSTRYDPELSG